MKERTLAIIKPDGTQRKLVGTVIGLVEERGFDITAMKMVRLSKGQAEEFYRVHRGKPFYGSVTDFMSSGPCVVMVLEADEGIEKWRKLMGATDFTKAEEGTIRRMFATDIEKNVVHGSDSLESAQYEIGFFFNGLEGAAP